MNTLDEPVERGTEDAEFIVIDDGQAFGQVAFAVGNVFHGAGHHVQRLDQQADQHAKQGDDDGHGNHGRDHCGGAEFAEHGERLIFVHRQADVPVHRRQAFDRREGHDAGLAVDGDFAEVAADARGVLRIGFFQGFHHQRLVRVDEDLAVGADQEHITHAVEIPSGEGVDQRLQTQVTANHTDALTGLFRGGGDGDDQLAGGGVDVRFGQGRGAAALGTFIPRAHARIETVRHLRVRADGEVAGGIAQIGGHERRGQGFLLQQAGDVGRLGVDRNVLGGVLDQQNATVEPGLDIVGGDLAHLVEVVVQVIADRIAL
ncbi:hypothetical protein PS681_03570 [Pseudomonas fluorescens]|nr:hypothetical protein PS681_03570 [Pseudomonas fluorescens]